MYVLSNGAGEEEEFLGDDDDGCTSKPFKNGKNGMFLC